MANYYLLLRICVIIVSMPMIISWLSLTSFLVPRAANLCGIVKQSYDAHNISRKALKTQF
jgi:hypothetical protein